MSSQNNLTVVISRHMKNSLSVDSQQYESRKNYAFLLSPDFMEAKDRAYVLV